MRYAVTPACRTDLLRIAAYLDQHSATASRRVREALRAGMTAISRTPGIGHRRDDLADESLRVLPVYSYLIVYRPSTSPVQIVRVLHGAMDVSSAFRP